MHCPLPLPSRRVTSPYTDSLSLSETDSQLSDEMQMSSRHQGLALVRTTALVLCMLVLIDRCSASSGRQQRAHGHEHEPHLAAEPRAKLRRDATAAQVQPRQGRRADEETGAELLFLQVRTTCPLLRSDLVLMDLRLQGKEDCVRKAGRE